MTETPSSITCQRCGTRTTWTPYCPGCGAYLEFAGVPPWTPPAPDPASDDDDSSDSLPKTLSHDDESTPGHSPEPVPGQATADQSIPTASVGADHEHDDTAGESSDGTGVDGDLEANEPPPIKVRRGNPDPWWKLWARPIIEEPDKPPPAEAPLDTREHPSTHEEESAGVVRPKDVPAEIQSEEPAKALQATERTIAVGQGGGLGPLDGTPCPRCGFRNEATAHFCARCGLDFAVAVRTTMSTQQASEGSDIAKRPPQRRDWALIAFIAFLITVLIFVLLAPQPNPIFTAFANGFRAVSYWIAPTAGRSAPYDAIQASSTGFGSPASALAGNSTATYWASAISPNFGAGTTINFRLVDNYTLDRMLIQPGIQNGVLDVRALATPSQIRLTFFKAFPPDQDASLVEVDASTQQTDIAGDPDIGPSACPYRLQPIATTSTSSPSADPSASSTMSASRSPSASPTVSPSASPTVAPTPSPTSSPTNPTASATPGPSAAETTKSPSTSPGPITPVGSPSTSKTDEAQCNYVWQSTEVFELPLIMNLSDYSTVLQFPKVDAARIQLDIVSVYRPRFADPYSPNSSRGQVAITNVLFYPEFTVSELFNSALNVSADPASPSPSLSPSPTASESASASASPTSSTAATATSSPSAAPSS